MTFDELDEGLFDDVLLTFLTVSLLGRCLCLHRGRTYAVGLHEGLF